MSAEPNLYIDAAWRSLNKQNEELCGDRVQIRRNEKGVVLVLADGLGSGVKANILSTLTSTIIAEMIFSGMALGEAVETIAATLPVCKERGIAYSTFTIIQIDYTGEVYIAEFDNPAVVVLRNGKCLPHERTVQKTNGRTVFVTKMTAEVGDCFVAFSDGVLHAGTGIVLNFGWGQSEVEAFLQAEIRPEDPAREIARILLANVNYLYGSRPQDDSTVACLRIVKATDTRVMVGPPSRAEDDEKVVRRLLEADGKKICCGGTTSQIAARFLKKEVTVDTQDILNRSAHVPPKGYIEGIDLVTEGMLTLQRAALLIAKAVLKTEYMEDLLLSKQQDGATLLAKMLLEASRITFLVGLSDNPAHAAIDYSPISLNAKVQLIQEMAENLRQAGRIVRVEMY